MQRHVHKFHKQQIAGQFNRAANSYQANANLQQYTGENLLSLLTKENLSPTDIIDLGCGTGYFTQALNLIHPAATIIGIDIADKMLQLINPVSKNVWKTLADFDQLPFPDKKINLIFSNMALQWSLDIKTTLIEWRRILKHNNYLLFSTLSSQSFTELKYCSESANYPLCLNKLHSVDTINNIVDHCGLEKIFFKSEILTVFFDDLLSLLRHFKKIGANHLVNKKINSIMTKGHLSHLARSYQQLSLKNKLPLSFEVIYCLAKRI